MRGEPIVVALALALAASGCVPHIVAGYPSPDYVSRPRSARTFRVEARDDDPALEVCSPGVCVRGMGAQLASGVRDALAQVAQAAPEGAPADYVARVGPLVLDSSLPNRWSSIEMSLTWAFTLYDARSNQVVVDASDTETITVPGSVYAERFAVLERRVIRRVQALVERSPLGEGH